MSVQQQTPEIRPAQPGTWDLPGVPESAPVARRLAREALGPGHLAADVVLLLVTELVTNALTHSKSGDPGGIVTVTLRSGPGGEVRVEVLDDGGPTVPAVTAPAGRNAQHGRGLRLVDQLAAAWGTRESGHRRVTWFMVTGPTASAL